jgi:hypothetical protein
VLPNVSILADREKTALRNLVARKGRLVITGVDSTGLESSDGIKRFPDCPGKAHLSALDRNFAEGARDDPRDFLASLIGNPELSIDGSAFLATNIALVNGQPHIFIANFGGLVPHKVGVPALEGGVRIAVPARRRSRLRFLPFLGEVQTLSGTRDGDRLVFGLPKIERGGVAWIEDTN